MRQQLALLIARYARIFAQWLDPLPDEVSALHAHIEQLREDRAHAHRDLDQSNEERAQDAVAYQTEVAKAQEETNAVERVHLDFKRLHAHCVPVQRDDVYLAAVSLTLKWADRQASGEYKRHQVLSSLIDAFPSRPHKDLALAIEAALAE